VAALLAGYEFYHLLRMGDYKPSYIAGLLLIAVLMLDAYYPPYGLWRWGIAAAIMLLMARQILHKDARGFLTNWSLTLAGALYVGGMLGHLISLRNLSAMVTLRTDSLLGHVIPVRELPWGFAWIVMTCAVTWLCDSGAYFVGSKWGRHGFFTHISPHKTWEGAIAGFVSGTLTALLVGQWLGLAVWQSLLLGAILVVGATCGDLAESLIKRQVGVKDSSRLIPGHGGMLDRVDSLLFAGVIVYYFALWVARAGLQSIK
jgi:phosphatidate cytidylyltransferase